MRPQDSAKLSWEKPRAARILRTRAPISRRSDALARCFGKSLSDICIRKILSTTRRSESGRFSGGTHGTAGTGFSAPTEYLPDVVQQR